MLVFNEILNYKLLTIYFILFLKENNINQNENF